jgi:hypothetical protein
MHHPENCTLIYTLHLTLCLITTNPPFALFWENKRQILHSLRKGYKINITEFMHIRGCKVLNFVEEQGCLVQKFFNDTHIDCQNKDWVKNKFCKKILI